MVILMDNRKKDGIIIDTKGYSEEGKKANISVFPRILQLLAMILGSWSFLSIFIESFSIQTNVTPMNIVLIVSSMIFFLFFLFPSYGIVKAFFTILFYILFCYSRFPRLQNAFYILENAVILQWNKYYETEFLFYVANDTSAKEDLCLFFSLMVIPITALLGAALLQKRMRGFVYILLMSPIIASFLIGVVPAEHHLIIILLVSIFLSKVHGNAYTGEGRFPLQLKSKVGMKVATILCGISLILFFLLKWMVSPADYESVQEIKTIKSKIQTALFDFSLEDVAESFSKFKISNRMVAAGGLSGGQLGVVDQVSFTNTEHLRITVPFPSAYEGIYLKGYVGNIYTGNSWEDGNKDVELKYEKLMEKIPLHKFSPINQVSLLLEKLARSMDASVNGLERNTNTFSEWGYDFASHNRSNNRYQFYEGNITISYKDANKNYLYLPYFSKPNPPEAIEYKLDLYAFPKSRKENYEFNYYFDIHFNNSSGNLIDGNIAEISSDYDEYEKAYRNYVYDVYTQLPASGLDRLKKDFAQENLDRDLDSISEKIRYVKEYLHLHTEYSLSPGKLPKGQDFVEYFLYENQIGYCAHYASAATLMLRAMGVPARYIEGYCVGQNEIIQSNSLKEQRIKEYSEGTDNSYVVRQMELSVMDYNAHAWVEIYMDHSGWIPVEFTPGSASEYTDTIVASMEQLSNNMKQNDEQNVPTITPIAPSPTPIEETYGDKETKPTALPDIETTKEKEKLDEVNRTNGIINKAFIIVIGTVMVLGTLGIIAPIKFKKNRIRRSNDNQKALFLYKEIEKMITAQSGLLKRKELLEDHFDYVMKNHPYLNAEEFIACMEIIQRARFGRASISRKDLEKVLQFYEDLFETTYDNSSFGKKLYLIFQLLF